MSVARIGAAGKGSTKKKAKYQGHTWRPSQKHQPYVFSGNTGLEFQLVVVAGCYLPSSSHSSSFSQLKSQPCISRDYVGLMFLVTGVAGVFGVALVLALAFGVQKSSKSAIYKKWQIVSNLINFRDISCKTFSCSFYWALAPSANPIGTRIPITTRHCLAWKMPFNVKFVIKCRP
jgi:hypothetical protein